MNVSTVNGRNKVGKHDNNKTLVAWFENTSLVDKIKNLCPCTRDKPLVDITPFTFTLHL